jgi:hypothetical protein
MDELCLKGGLMSKIWWMCVLVKKFVVVEYHGG